MEAAWPGLAIEESNLTVQIAALRRAFAAVEGGSTWIETLPRRGYRYVGPPATTLSDASRQTWLLSATSDKPSIAVLPFLNLPQPRSIRAFAIPPQLPNKPTAFARTMARSARQTSGRNLRCER
jgi:DNA-binding winged helix-turn-helix (wHTH) protein